jgi:hypothetical protein
LASRVITAEAALRVVPNIGSWRNFAVSFSAFPESVGQVAARNAITQISRDDALAFTALVGRGPERTPIFSDYAVGVPFYADVRWMPIPSIKYASGESWFVHRGATKDNRNSQYVQLATNVVGSAEYAGASASDGDAYFEAVAHGHVGPGNPMTYVRAATSRHLACVLNRLAMLGVP